MKLGFNMSKKPKKVPEVKLSPEELNKIKNELKGIMENELRLKPTSDTVTNGLLGALFGAGVPGGGIPTGPGVQNVSQVNELYNNLRWYFLSNFWQLLSEMYCELGLIQTIVNVPVDDGLRGGVEIKSKQLSPEQLDQLKDVVDREDDIGKVAQALKWVRLFGGGGVMVLTDQDPKEPLDIDAIDQDSPLEFRAVDMWELYFDLQNTEGYDAAIQEEKYEYYSYYGAQVHKSRVMKMKGLNAPSFLRPRLRGWGFSVVEATVRSINQYLEGTDLIYELIDEAKIDVFGIKNLTNTLLSPNGTQQVRQRIQLANQQKDFQHALVMDAEDHYEQKTLTFSGLAEVMEQVRYQVACDLRMPLTKIFGISAAGFNSGEDDIEVYNGMIESTIRQQAKVDILRVLELRCQKCFGFIPDDLSIEFKPLRVLGADKLEEVRDKKFTRLLQSLQAGAITLEEFRTACTKESLLGIDLDQQGLEEVIAGQSQGMNDAKEGNPNEEQQTGKAKPTDAINKYPFTSDPPQGSDRLGNVPGVDEQSIEKSAEQEEAQANLSYLSSPPAKKKADTGVYGKKK